MKTPVVFFGLCILASVLRVSSVHGHGNKGNYHSHVCLFSNSSPFLWNRVLLDTLGGGGGSMIEPKFREVIMHALQVLYSYTSTFPGTLYKVSSISPGLWWWLINVVVLCLYHYAAALSLPLPSLSLFYHCQLILKVFILGKYQTYHTVSNCYFYI